MKTDNLVIASVIISIIATILLGIVVYGNRKCTKESLCLCNNLGGSIYKPQDNNPSVYNYPSNDFY